MTNIGSSFLQRLSVVKFQKAKEEERDVLQFWKPLPFFYIESANSLQVRGHTILVLLGAGNPCYVTAWYLLKPFSSWKSKLNALWSSWSLLNRQ